MEYFYVEPEVAGALGERTVMDRRVHPPIVEVLHYEVADWSGDVILTSFPVFIVTEQAKAALLGMGATGAAFDDVEVTVSDEFKEQHPDRKLPPFAWLKAQGKAGQDDIGTAADGRLVVSKRVLDTLRCLGISNALLEPFEGEALDFVKANQAANPH